MSVAYLNLMLNGLCDGVDKQLEKELPKGVDAKRRPKAHNRRSSGARGIINFTCAPECEGRHQDEKKDVLMATDLWCRQRIFDAIFLLTARSKENNSLALDQDFVKRYITGFGVPSANGRHTANWQSIKSLPDTIAHRLKERAMLSGKELWYEEDPRYTKKRNIRHGGHVYDTAYTQKLIEAYRIIRKNMAKYSRGFGAHHTGEDANYDDSLAVEMYELLSHAVECADAGNQMQHAIGDGVSKELDLVGADAVFV